MEINLEQLKTKYQSILSKANLGGKKIESKTLEEQSYESTFWSDPKKAGEIMSTILDKKTTKGIELLVHASTGERFGHMEDLQ